MANTTLKDYGRGSEQFGNIPYYYVFPYRFFFAGSHVEPEDVRSWCRQNCMGYYRIECYTHKDSVKVNGKWIEKRIYVDRLFISDQIDAVQIRLKFDVSEVSILRPEKWTV